MTDRMTDGLQRLLALAPALAFTPPLDATGSAARADSTAQFGAIAYTLSVTPAGVRATARMPDTPSLDLYEGADAARGRLACQLHAALRACGTDLSRFPRATHPAGAARRDHDRIRGYELIRQGDRPDHRWLLRDPDGVPVCTVECPRFGELCATAHALEVARTRLHPVPA